MGVAVSFYYIDNFSAFATPEIGLFTLDAAKAHRYN